MTTTSSAFDRGSRGLDQLQAPPRGAGAEAGLVLDEPAQADGVDPVDVLGRIDPGNDFLGVVALGQGQLDEDAVDAVVGVQGFDAGLEVGPGDIRGQNLDLAEEPQALAGLFLHPQVALRGGIIAHQDADETGHLVHGLLVHGDLGLDQFADLVGDGFAFEPLSHERSPL